MYLSEFNYYGCWISTNPMSITVTHWQINLKSVMYAPCVSCSLLSIISIIPVDSDTTNLKGVVIAMLEVAWMLSDA